MNLSRYITAVNLVFIALLAGLFLFGNAIIFILAYVGMFIFVSMSKNNPYYIK